MSGKNYALNGAVLKCTMGDVTSKLKVTSQKKYKVQGKKVATMMDFIPGVNVKHPVTGPLGVFGTCKPYKALPPPAQLCTPIPMGPWLMPHMTQKIQGKPALLENSCLMCARAMGRISIQKTNQKKGK